MLQATETRTQYQQLNLPHADVLFGLVCQNQVLLLCGGGFWRHQGPSSS